MSLVASWALGDELSPGELGSLAVFEAPAQLPCPRSACVHLISPLCFSVLLMKIINQVLFLSHPAALQGQDLNKVSL